MLTKKGMITMVYRVYVSKKTEYAGEDRSLFNDLKSSLGIRGVLVSDTHLGTPKVPKDIKIHGYSSFLYKMV